jgi:hypothetical protein
MKITSTGPQSIGQMAKHFSHGNLYLSPDEYQRENAWDIGQKKLLVDTVFRRMDIPKFYLWKIDEKTLHGGYPLGPINELYRRRLDEKRKKNDETDPYLFWWTGSSVSEHFWSSWARTRQVGMSTAARGSSRFKPFPKRPRPKGGYMQP